jgi:hypothetical protein
MLVENEFFDLSEVSDESSYVISVCVKLQKSNSD